MFILWQGSYEAASSRHLELQGVQEGGGGGRVRLLYNSCSNNPQCCQASPRNEGDVNTNGVIDYFCAYCIDLFSRCIGNKGGLMCITLACLFANVDIQYCVPLVK